VLSSQRGLENSAVFHYVVADLLARPQKVETIDNEEAPLRALIEERALTH